MTPGPAEAGGAAASPEATCEVASPEATCEVIERCITRLVREAPALDQAVVAELIERLRDIGSPLALSIARIVELVAEGLVAQGVALPHLAMSCATLADGVAGRVSERELDAARYEVDTLLPVPDAPGARPPGVRIPDILDIPDVPLGALTRGPRRQT